MIVYFILINKYFFSRSSIYLWIDLNLICILKTQYEPCIKAIVKKLQVPRFLTEET